MKWVWMVVVSMALAACNSDQTAPPFEDLTREELQTSMGRLALHVDVLEALLASAGQEGPDAQRIVSVLKQMLSHADALPANALEHPVHKSFATRLRQDIDVALHAARRPEPDYEPARLVVSSCTYCHERRRYQQVTRLYEEPR